MKQAFPYFPLLADLPNTESENILSWKGPTRVLEFNSWPCTGYPKSHTMCLRAVSRFFLNSVRLGAVITSLGSLFQCPNTLWVKNFFLILSLNLPRHICIVYLVTQSGVKMITCRNLKDSTLNLKTVLYLSPELQMHLKQVNIIRGFFVCVFFIEYF